MNRSVGGIETRTMPMSKSISREEAAISQTRH